MAISSLQSNLQALDAALSQLFFGTRPATKPATAPAAAAPATTTPPAPDAWSQLKDPEQGFESSYAGPYVSGQAGKTAIGVSKMLEYLDIAAAAWLVLSERSQAMADATKNLMSGIQKRTEKMREYNKQLAAEYNKPEAARDAQGNVTQTGSQYQSQATITRIKGNIDAVTQEQQLDMAQLQDWIGKHNMADTLLSSIVKSFQDTANGIVGKIA